MKSRPEYFQEAKFKYLFLNDNYISQQLPFRGAVLSGSAVLVRIVKISDTGIEGEGSRCKVRGRRCKVEGYKEGAHSLGRPNFSMRS